MTLVSTADKPLQVLLVTGMSGAGKTTLLKALEDLGYEAVDNLPLSFVTRLVDPVAAREAGETAIAVSLDFRTREFGPGAFAAMVREIDARGNVETVVVFLDCQDEVLARRFTETRRRHPLSDDVPVDDAIRLERGRLRSVVDGADIVIDTTDMSPRELARLAAERFSLEVSRRMTVIVQSFSYRLGLPREADLVFDVRFLANPHYEVALKPLSGRDAAVAEFIRQDPCFAPFLEVLLRMLELLLPQYVREGKSYLTLAIGCTGGRHRSVFVAETVAERLRGAGHTVILRHRDLSDEASA